MRFEETYKQDKVAFGAVLKSWPPLSPSPSVLKPRQASSRAGQGQAYLTSAAAGNADVQVKIILHVLCRIDPHWWSS